MYLHLGQSVVVPYEAVLGIFDLDNASWSHRTRAFLEKAEREGRVVLATEDLPRSFVLCQRWGDEPVIYLCQPSSATLKSRMEGKSFE